ncbi:histidine kinase/DNA gyrase B/HSP90-like ATPase [Nonomuraea polychroma]|uniref:histidine kinase n=1 Tax=Nonomuraea polychroma TaxID=46176 RepID=A0A438MCD2_9ACTN|nr:ATP-binding protein [Nonomuraea polychroma]RVX43241.1 histidine kinase/DNA gyrase B/HSP90-like ATPase [Nonomuraea polychroma]
MIARLTRSIRTRLALFAGVATALVCLVSSSLLLWAVHSTAVDIRRNEVIGAALRVVHLIKTDELPTILSLDLEGLQVVDANGQVAASTPNLAGSPRMTTVIPAPDNTNRMSTVCDLPQFSGDCHILITLRVYEPEGDWMVYAFGSMVPWYVHPAVLGVLACTSVALVALAWFGASRVVAGTLAPVNEITERLSEITGGDQSMRVPVPENAEEIKALAETANRTLARLGDSMEQQRRFTSDASHDLRSPITAMRAELEEALPATAEAARPRSKRVLTTLQPGVIVMGDRLRLARLLTNLLDNAERHAESTIAVTVRRDGEAVLEVLDDGAGIAPEHREVVFRRFARLDAARNRDVGGTGLGLPIARQIAEAHGGTLTIEDSERSARFVLRIPTRKD